MSTQDKVYFLGFFIFLFSSFGVASPEQGKEASQESKVISSKEEFYSFKREVLTCLKSIDENCVKRFFVVPFQVIWTDVDKNLEGGKCRLNSEDSILNHSELLKCLKLGLLKEAVKNCLSGDGADVIGNWFSSHGDNYVCEYRYENGTWKVIDAITML